VREMRADVGVALDGDADRLIVIDEKGHVIDGDQILAVVAESWKADGRLSKPGVVATVMSNLGLERHLGGVGLALERTAVGDRYVLERMVEKGYNVGGEQSGHMILTDYSTTGDGLVAAMQVLAMIKRQGKPASEVCRRFEPLPQLLRNVRFNGGRPLESDNVVRTIAAARERLGDTGRLVIRASGTEPVIRVMAEAEDSVLVDSLVAEICEAVRKAAA
jgi:phosphoglucosamine mutase